MNEMVERVAKALFLWQHGHDRWDEAEPEVREDACEAARAVIEAMREPTPAMLAVGNHNLSGEPSAADTVEEWGAMIEEALK